MRPSTRTISVFLFGSGFAALVYQTAWQRMLRLVFGASTGATAAVLGIFLGGLGLGGLWLSRRVERSPRPLSFYGNLEAGIAIAAAVSPLLVDLCGELYFALGGSRTLGWSGATLARLVLAAVVMGPAVVLMGGTLPAAARAVEAEGDVARGRLAMLYSVNTAGAVAGALLATFFLFEAFGTRLTLWLACLVNLLVAVSARAVGRGAPAVEVSKPRTEDVRPTAAASSDRAPLASSTPTRLIVYALAGFVGFAFLALELIWYRMLAPLLGGSSFTFGLVLAVALAGIGLGGALYARRNPAESPSLALLALTMAIEAVCVCLPLALGDRIAIYAAATHTLTSLGFSALVASWSLITVVVVGPAAVASGYQFPVLFALLGKGREGVARHVGLAYACNTVGAISGSLMAGFVLIPAVGAVGVWRLLVGLLALLAIGTAALAMRKGPRLTAGFAVAGAAVALMALRAEGPTAVWRHSPIGAGRTDLSGMTRNQLSAWQVQTRNAIAWERDGLESTVGIDDKDGYSFIVNGKSDGAVVGDRGTQVMIGLLPAMLHPDPKTVFVLGLGTGMSAGWVADVASVQRVDVAEIEPAMIEVARRSALANRAVLSNPKVHIFQGDGREFLLTTNQKFDLVVSEPSNPFRAGIASLFTQEFYQTVDRHLNGGGTFGQWLQGYEIDAPTVRLAMRTMRSVFPFVEAWHTQGGDFLFLATREAPVHDMALLRRRVGEEPFRSALPRAWLVQDGEGVLAHFVASNALLELVNDSSQGMVNSDDTNLLEYAFARNVGVGGYDAVADLTTLAVARGMDLPAVSVPVDWVRVKEQRSRAWLVGGAKSSDVAFGDAQATRRATAVQEGCVGRVDKVRASWGTDQPAPRDMIEVFALGQGLAFDRSE
ncbi:MAG: fused MFS/spermidine synthase, partial [Myxococcota bacterium]|nr:fused MFS/spermidine synthase [Myxococcota bacterium]